MEATETTIRELVSNMTLEEKIQLTIGKGFWSTYGVERLGLAPIALNDGPHGIRKPADGDGLGMSGSIPTTCFPTAAALASSWDTALIAEVGRALAEECLALDIQVLLGPGVNIKRTPLGGRNFEYFSEDPVLAGEMGAAFVNAVQQQGVGTSLKHYACNNQEFERMTISAEVDQRVLRELYLAAFERVVRKARPWTVMSAYNRVNGIYASEHPQLLNGILKQEWGFDGVIVSDWGAVNIKEKALAAGLDLEMPEHYGKHTAHIAQLVRDGALSEAVINEAATRLVRLLLRGHAGRRPGTSFDQAAHHALARRVAAESMVLLKNTDNLLPLDPDSLSTLAIIGRFARAPRYQGAGSSHVTPTHLDTPYDELQSWLAGQSNLTLSYADGYPDDTQTGEQEVADAEELLRAAVAQAQAADVAIIFAGLPDAYESEGADRTHISLPETHNRLITEICRVQPNTVVVLHNGSVVAMPWLAGPKAVLEAGLGGQAMGGAVVDILSGKVNPSGKLAETFPARLEDTPAYLNYPGEAGRVYYGEGLFVGYRYYDKKQIAPLFPFGYGLSYTTFAYEHLQISASEVNAGETLTVTVTVRNSGARAGKEVVQLYLRPLTSEFVRPVKELKAFAKVTLAAGESKEVVLSLEDRDFQVWDSRRSAWIRDGGQFEILVGASSADIRLRTTITVQEDPHTALPPFDRLSPLKHFLRYPKGRAVLKAAFGDNPAARIFMGNNEMYTAMPLAKMLSFGILDEPTIERVVEQMNAPAEG